MLPLRLTTLPRIARCFSSSSNLQTTRASRLELQRSLRVSKSSPSPATSPQSLSLKAPRARLANLEMVGTSNASRSATAVHRSKRSHISPPAPGPKVPSGASSVGSELSVAHLSATSVYRSQRVGDGGRNHKVGMMPKALSEAEIEALKLGASGARRAKESRGEGGRGGIPMGAVSAVACVVAAGGGVWGYLEKTGKGTGGRKTGVEGSRQPLWLQRER
ncbi:hypothetical protein TrCOL_g13707 [Triparma columacea]|uniref:Uncharacterized protein n=1 Tax=Triparma columacea TaxID=722753 RepID=A0A9W7GJV2_9STRA|nr:hypothetical protein TrCOL_g13707 [Triparma columacea]